MVATTGVDVAAETRAFNRRLADKSAALPRLHEMDDPASARAAIARGEGPFAAPVRLPEGTDRLVPGRAAKIQIRVFTAPVVRGVYLNIHGGGWTFGSADSEDPLLWRLARSAAVAVVSVDYRLAPEAPYPCGPDDCEDVARWLIRSAGQEFGTDRLVIGGESAGAHLAVTTLLRLGAQARAFCAANCLSVSTTCR